MDADRITEKLNILADAAKYDVSCASSGSKRKNENKGLGNASNGICHSYTEDGRCVSLLKILLTNHCIYDCAYCVSRKSNDIKRAAFTVQEVVDLHPGTERVDVTGAHPLPATLVQGIIATRLNRGRVFGVIAIVAAGLAPILSFIVYIAAIGVASQSH